MQAKILVLSGASGAGKSTLGKYLLAATKSKWVHLEADRLAPDLSSAAGVEEFDQGAYLKALLASMLAWPAAGFNAIMDGVLPYPEGGLFHRCVRALRKEGARFVDVHAPVDTVARRIEARGVGDVEWAVRQLADINTSESMDFSVDTATDLEGSRDVSVILRWMDSEVSDD